MKTSSNTVITLRINTNLRDRIKKQAQSENRSMSKMIEQYLLEFFKEESKSAVRMTKNIEAALRKSQKDIESNNLDELDLNNLSSLFE